MDRFIVGEVYEIDPYIKISWNGLPPKPPCFARLLGFSSRGNPVFESDGKFFEVEGGTAKITEIKKEAA